jgi:AAA15 family ATPase/GTPase
LLIDELESSLHPKLAREIVRMINSSEFNRSGAQVIFTTHNTNLLDLSLLRRDQIWFTEKGSEGATKLYPLSNYQPRTGQNIEAGYLGGRFGAIPFLDRELLREVQRLAEGDSDSSESVAAITSHSPSDEGK